MQVCTSPQTDNHASTPTQFFTGQMPFLQPNQQRQSTEGNNTVSFVKPKMAKNKRKALYRDYLGEPVPER